jgi:hypothetical protein
MLPIPVTLEKLTVESGTLIYDNRRLGVVATVGTIDQQARISIDPGLQNIATDGTLRLGDISLKTAGFDAPLTGLAVTVTHDIGADLPEGTVTVRRLTASCGKISGTVTGTVKDVLTGAPMLDLTLGASTINIQDLVAILPLSLVPFAPKLAASGTLTTGARLQGRLLPGKPPLLSGTAKFSQVAINYAGLPRSIDSLNASVEFTDKSVTVNPLTMRLGTSPISVTAVVTDLKKRLFDAKIKADLNLDEMKDIVGLPPGAALGGKVAADIQADGVIDPTDPGKLYCTGTVDFREVRLLWPPLRSAAAINGGVIFAKEAARAHVTAAVERSTLVADATVTHYLWFAAPPRTKNAKRPVIEARLTSPFLDIDNMLNLSRPAPAGAGSTSAPAAAGSASPDLLFAPPLPGADLHATVSAKQIVYKGFAMNGVAAKITSADNGAAMKFSSSFSTGTIDNEFHADGGPGKKLSFSDKFTVKNVELNDFFARFGDLVSQPTPLGRQLMQLDRGLYGRISLEGALEGAGDTPARMTTGVSGGFALNMKDGRLQNTPIQNTAAAAMRAFLKSDNLEGIDPVYFKELGASVRIADGRAFIDELKIRSDLGDWNARGSVSFDADMDMAVSTRLSKAASAGVLAVEGAAKGAAKNLLAGTQLAAAAGLLDNVSLIPHDNEGRISLTFVLSGPVASPRAGSLAFGEVGRASPGGQAAAGGAAKGKQDAQREMIRKAGEQIRNTLRGLLQ